MLFEICRDMSGVLYAHLLAHFPAKKMRLKVHFD